MAEPEIAQRARIMVVEDEAIVARDIAQSLKTLGYEVAGTAASADEALELAAATSPTLAFMDIRIQGPVDGVETASRLAERFDIPVIFLTAHSDPRTLDRAISVHPYGYLVKPPDDREIQTSVAVALSRHHEDQRSRVMERALEVAGFAVLMMNADVEGNPITHGNAAFEQMSGWRVAEVVGRAPWFLDAEGGESSSARMLRDAVRAGSACRADWACVGRSGRVFEADAALSFVRDSRGRPTHALLCLSASATSTP